MRNPAFLPVWIFTLSEIIYQEVEILKERTVKLRADPPK